MESKIAVYMIVGLFAISYIGLVIYYFYNKRKLERFDPSKNKDVIEGIIEDVEVNEDGLICIIRRLDNNKIMRTNTINRGLVAKLDMKSLKFITYHYEYDSIKNKHIKFIPKEDGIFEYDIILKEQINRLKIACISATTVIISLILLILTLILKDK